MSNEVEIVVTARNDTNMTFSDVVAKAKVRGEEVGDKFSTGLSGRIAALGGRVADGARDIGGKVGNKIFDGLKKVDKISEVVGEKVIGGLGKLGTALPGVLGDAVGKLPPQGQALAGVLVAGLLSFLAPMLAAAISTAVLLAVGGGVLALGIKSAIDDPKVAKSFKGLGEKAKKVFEDFGEPFKAPLERAARTFGGVLDDLKGPIKTLGATIAPVIDTLAPALAAFFKQIMPGIQSAVEGAVPLFNTLAEKLPLIGEAINQFFESISDNSGDTTDFFGDMLELVAGLIGVLGDVIGWLAGFYESWKEAFGKCVTTITGFARVVIDIFGSILDAAVAALGWVPGLGPKLKGAQQKFKEFRDKANTYLDGIDKSVDVTATIRMRVVGLAVANAALSTARILAGYKRAGGIQGAATGGSRSNMTMVGEDGPELVDLGAGARVLTNGDSKRALQSMGGGGSSTVVFKFDPSGAPGLISELFKAFRLEIAAQGGNVQQVLGVVGK